MTIRSIATICILSLTLLAGSANAAAIAYTINFTGGGPGVLSIGPGSFSFDSMGQTNTTVGPPAGLTNFMVPVLESIATIGNQVIFTQTSPEDDSAVLGPAGLVSAVSVDSVNGIDLLQLNTDGTWTLSTTPMTPTGIAQAGTYSITADIPEPATLGIVAAGLLALGLIRRKRT